MQNEPHSGNPVDEAMSQNATPKQLQIRLIALAYAPVGTKISNKPLVIVPLEISHV